MSTSLYKPDCGYAWIVVAACFTINFIVGGLNRVAGVLYVALIDVYSVSRETATTPFSLRYCVRNLSGPLVGALGQRFGIRPIVLLGGVLSGLGGILAALAPNVTWITIAWGGIHGIGYGMCNIIHVIIINRYFRKYKGLALGISLTGDCCGTFLLPILLEFLLETYGLKGTFFIIAGISLNIIPAAMLLRSPPWEDRETLDISADNMKYVNNRDTVKQGITNECFYITPEDCESKDEMKKIGKTLHAMTINEEENNEKIIQSNKCYPYLGISYDLNNQKPSYMDLYTGNKYKKHRLKEEIKTRADIEQNISFKTEIILINMPELRQQSAFLQFLKTNLKPMFLIISATMAFYVFLFITILTIIIDYASDNHIPSEYGKFLIISFSVTDLFGRLGFGVVLDRKLIPIGYYAGLTTGLMGIFVLVIPLFKCFTFWIISFSLCGFVQGGTAIMYPLLVEHYMEKHEESVALGCLNFYGGLLMLPIPPMIGFFRDSIGSYDGVFWTVGGLCILAGSLWIFEPCMVRKKEKKMCQNMYNREDGKI